jgi:Fe-S-cluster containining protein
MCCHWAAGKEELKSTGPIYSGSGGRFYGLPLYGWEARRLQKLCKPKLVPQEFVVDRRNKRLAVLRWAMPASQCPLLKGECDAYSSRALVCKAFPVMSSGIEGIEARKKFAPLSSKECPTADVKKIERPAKVSQAIKAYWDYFGDAYLNAVAIMRTELALRRLAAVLEHAGAIECGTGLGNEDILTLVDGSNWVDVVELYARHFGIPKKEVDAFTADLEGLGKAKETVEDIILAFKAAGN